MAWWLLTVGCYRASQVDQPYDCNVDSGMFARSWVPYSHHTRRWVLRRWTTGMSWLAPDTSPEKGPVVWIAFASDGTVAGSYGYDGHMLLGLRKGERPSSGRVGSSSDVKEGGTVRFGSAKTSNEGNNNNNNPERRVVIIHHRRVRKGRYRLTLNISRTTTANHLRRGSADAHRHSPTNTSQPPHRRYARTNSALQAYEAAIQALDFGLWCW
jgi:hypothetical protein